MKYAQIHLEFIESGQDEAEKSTIEYSTMNSQVNIKGVLYPREIELIHGIIELIKGYKRTEHKEQKNREKT